MIVVSSYLQVMSLHEFITEWSCSAPRGKTVWPATCRWWWGVDSILDWYFSPAGESHGHEKIPGSYRVESIILMHTTYLNLHVCRKSITFLAWLRFVARIFWLATWTECSNFSQKTTTVSLVPGACRQSKLTCTHTHRPCCYLSLSLSLSLFLQLWWLSGLLPC